MCRVVVLPDFVTVTACNRTTSSQLIFFLVVHFALGQGGLHAGCTVPSLRGFYGSSSTVDQYDSNRRRREHIEDR